MHGRHFARNDVLTAWLVLCVLVSVAAGSAMAAKRGLGHRPPTPAEQAHIDAVYTGVTQVPANDLARARVKAEAETAGATGRQPSRSPALPSAVDNSILQYFPPIGNQGNQGSCTCWASCYYYSTYTQAMDEGYNVSAWDPDHTLSPDFMYPLVNDGLDLGANTQFVMSRLNDVGASSWALEPYSELDWTSWPSEAAWVEALQYRTDSSYVIDGSTPSGLDAIKQQLANGYVVVTDFSVYETWCCYYPGDATGISNEVYYYPDGDYAGGHAVTIVGYDDAKSYVDHRDAQTYYGAFLVANSWGPDWGVGNSTGGGPGDYGFFWVGYNMFLESTFGPYAYYNDDRADYRPKLYAVAGVNHAQRGVLHFDGDITDCPIATCWESYDAIYYDGGTALPVTDADRIAVDMTDGLPPTPENLRVLVWCYVDASASTDATITSAEFHHDLDGDGSYGVAYSTDPTVTVSPNTWGWAEAFIHSAPEVVLEVHPNERAPGASTNQYLGKQPWTQPTSSAAGSYWWKKYEFAAHGPLWVQICAQNWDKTQKGYGDHDDTQLQFPFLGPLVPVDYDGIQSGAAGTWQWAGGAESGKRTTLRFLVPCTPGKQVLWIGADESPVLWWLKVIDLEPVSIEPL